MKKFTKVLQVFLLITALQFSLPTHANWIERILANPKVQVLVGKPAELTNALKLCENVNYRNANQVACSEAQQAAMVNSLPAEMRVVMSSSKSAQSLRDLCLAAQNTPQRESYLCTELAKADKDFGAAMQGARIPVRVQEDNTR